MYVIPAIDLRDGKCVRLIQGQYDHQITYKDDPLAQAQEFQAAGAQWLHVVDLDGAKAGVPTNTTTISQIVAHTDLNVEVGGGLRDEQAIKQLLDLGVKRAIIGTKAVSAPHFVNDLCLEFPGHIIVGLDAKEGKVAIEEYSIGQTIT